MENDLVYREMQNGDYAMYLQPDIVWEFEGLPDEEHHPPLLPIVKIRVPAERRKKRRLGRPKVYNRRSLKALEGIRHDHTYNGSKVMAMATEGEREHHPAEKRARKSSRVSRDSGIGCEAEQDGGSRESQTSKSPLNYEDIVQQAMQGFEEDVSPTDEKLCLEEISAPLPPQSSTAIHSAASLDAEFYELLEAGRLLLGADAVKPDATFATASPQVDIKCTLAAPAPYQPQVTMQAAPSPFTSADCIQSTTVSSTQAEKAAFDDYYLAYVKSMASRGSAVAGAGEPALPFSDYPTSWDYTYTDEMMYGSGDYSQTSFYPTTSTEKVSSWLDNSLMVDSCVYNEPAEFFPNAVFERDSSVQIDGSPSAPIASYTALTEMATYDPVSPFPPAAEEAFGYTDVSDPSMSSMLSDTTNFSPVPQPTTTSEYEYTDEDYATVAAWLVASASHPVKGPALFSYIESLIGDPTPMMEPVEVSYQPATSQSLEYYQSMPSPVKAATKSTRKAPSRPRTPRRKESVRLPMVPTPLIETGGSVLPTNPYGMPQQQMFQDAYGHTPMMQMNSQVTPPLSRLQDLTNSSASAPHQNVGKWSELESILNSPPRVPLQSLPVQQPSSKSILAQHLQRRRRSKHPYDVNDGSPPAAGYFAESVDGGRKPGRPRKSPESVSPPYVHKPKELKPQTNVNYMVFIGNVPEKITKEHLELRFSKYGHIVRVARLCSKEKGHHAYLLYSFKQDAIRAAKLCNEDPSLPMLDIQLQQYFTGRGMSHSLPAQL